MSTRASFARYQQGQHLWYHPTTCRGVRAALEAAFATKYVFRIWLGDVSSGRAWPYASDLIGSIGRTEGKVRLATLQGRAEGERRLPDESIVRIDLVSPASSAEAMVYRHETFAPGTWEVVASDRPGYVEVALHDGVVQARFKVAGDAARYIDFMTGRRNAP